MNLNWVDNIFFFVFCWNFHIKIKFRRDFQKMKFFLVRKKLNSQFLDIRQKNCLRKSSCYFPWQLTRLKKLNENHVNRTWNVHLYYNQRYAMLFRFDFFSIWFWCLPQCECSLQFWHTENLSAFISIGLVTFVPEIAFSVLFFICSQCKWLTEREMSVSINIAEKSLQKSKCRGKKENERERWIERERITACAFQLH